MGFYTELDFKNEGANMDKMRELLDAQGVRDVWIPAVYPQYTSRRVLVTEWVDGVKLSECTPDQVRDLLEVGQEVFLTQLLQVGFFHSDPHPGNLMRPHDQSKGKLALIDFGLVAQVEQEDMDGIISSIVHLANKDYAALVDDFIALKILPADTNRVKVCHPIPPIPRLTAASRLTPRRHQPRQGGAADGQSAHAVRQGRRRQAVRAGAQVDVRLRGDGRRRRLSGDDPRHAPT